MLFPLGKFQKACMFYIGAIIVNVSIQVISIWEIMRRICVIVTLADIQERASIDTTIVDFMNFATRH